MSVIILLILRVGTLSIIRALCGHWLAWYPTPQLRLQLTALITITSLIT